MSSQDLPPDDNIAYLDEYRKRLGLAPDLIIAEMEDMLDSVRASIEIGDTHGLVIAEIDRDGIPHDFHSLINLANPDDISEALHEVAEDIADQFLEYRDHDQ